MASPRITDIPNEYDAGTFRNIIRDIKTAIGIVSDALGGTSRKLDFVESTLLGSYGVTATLAPGATETIKTFSNSGLFVVSAIAGNGDANWHACGILVVRIGVVISLTSLITAGSLEISYSGGDVILKNTNPTYSVPIAWTIRPFIEV